MATRPAAFRCYAESSLGSQPDRLQRHFGHHFFGGGEGGCWDLVFRVGLAGFRVHRCGGGGDQGFAGFCKGLIEFNNVYRGVNRFWGLGFM